MAHPLAQLRHRLGASRSAWTLGQKMNFSMILKLKVIITVLIMALTISTYYAFKYYSEIYGVGGIGAGGWQSETYPLAVMFARRTASADFSRGILRVYEMKSFSTNSVFTGRRDGPFEVWNLYCYQELGPPHHYVQQQFATSYNDEMRRLQIKQKFQSKEQKTSEKSPQDDAPNFKPAEGSK